MSYRDITPEAARTMALDCAHAAELLLGEAKKETAPEWNQARSTEALAAATLGRLYADLAGPPVTTMTAEQAEAAQGPTVGPAHTFNEPVTVHVHVGEGADYEGVTAAIEDGLGRAGAEG